MNNNAADKLIVALDVQSASKARELVTALRGITRTFKIGSQLFTASGPEIVREIAAAGCRVFLDLKFHDIPNTVAAAAVEATRLGVWMFNVHASGGAEMMRRTVNSISDVAVREKFEKPLLIGVTVLTSTNAVSLSDTGVCSSVEEQVIKLALLVEDSGLDGVVASPNEASLIRATIKRRGFIVVTPGVRPTGALLDDQIRVNTPRAAITAGADFLVVGRAIIGADDPGKAAFALAEEIQSAMEERSFEKHL